MSIFTALAVWFALSLGWTTMAATAPNLGLVGNYAIYSDAGVTNFAGITTTHIWGSVGHNGFGATNLLVDPGQQVAGTIDAGAGVATVMWTAYTSMLGQATDTGLDLAGTNTIEPGIYDVASTTLNGTLTLSGAGVYIFKGASVSVGASANMVLTNGADACNVFWALTTRMHVVGGAHIIGTIITDVGGADITFGDGASLQGRAWAHTAITLRNNVITEPTCAASVATGGHARISRLIPLINVLKVPTPLSLSYASGLVTYHYTVQNVWPNLALANVRVSDDKCGPLVYISGDVNNDTKLNLWEKWAYSCTTRLSTTTTNIVTAYGESDDSYRDVALDTATATVAVGTGIAPLPSPLINIIKIPSRLSPFPVGGGNVKYTYIVSNPGVVALHDVVTTDNKCSPLVLISGDNNHDHLLDLTEKWIYTCDTHISVSTTNTATAQGTANGFTVYDHAFASVLVSTPIHAAAPVAPLLPKTGIMVEETTTPWTAILFVGFLALVFSIQLFVALKNAKIKA